MSGFMRKKMKKRTAALLILLLLAAAVFLMSAYLERSIYDSLAILQAYAKERPILGGTLFVVLAAFSVLLGPFSSVPFVPIAVAAWGSFLTLILLASGWLVGGIVAYGVGLLVGYPLIRYLIAPEKINKWIDNITGRLKFLFLLLFRFSTPSETGYLFGIIRYNFLKYVLITFIAEVPVAVIVVYASEALTAKRPILFVGFALFGISILVAALYLFRKELRKSS